MIPLAIEGVSIKRPAEWKSDISKKWQIENSFKRATEILSISADIYVSYD